MNLTTNHEWKSKDWGEREEEEKEEDWRHMRI